jgi:hypothetical protein
MRPSRGVLAILAIAAVGLGTAVALVDSGDDDVTQPRAVSCTPPPGSAMSPCPVEPATVGHAGEATYLPAGWRPLQSRSEALPTEERRIQTLDRYYVGPKPKGRQRVAPQLTISAMYGDVTAPTLDEIRPNDASAYADSQVRPGQIVIHQRNALPDGLDIYTWASNTPRIIFLLTATGPISDAEVRRIVAGVQDQP